MSQYKRIAIDTSKAVFTLHVSTRQSGQSFAPISTARR